MPSGIVPAAAPIELHNPSTPLRPLELERELASHPDRGFVGQLIHNLVHGCRIGYDGPQFAHIAPHLPSAYAYSTVVDSAIAKECQANRMAGPYPYPPLPNLRCSGLGVVPKKDGSWRLIYHLSAPHGSSINDFIDPESYSLSYCTIDDAIAIVTKLGPGTLMGKIDLKNAFRLCPVSKEDWPLLGIYWRGNYYIDKCLPFGLRSAPYLFNLLASGLEWILIHNYGLEWLLHYLDDLFTAGPPGTNICHRNMRCMLSLCSHVNAPVKPEKVEGPSTLITFLGILLDTVAMQASITLERKAEIVQALSELRGKHTCTKKQLLSLIGKLAFACKVVPPGRIFLRRLIDLSTTVGPIHHHITINQEARRDIQWWIDFLPDWPGTSLFREPHWSTAYDMELYTDASDKGYGAYWSGKWFNSTWTSWQSQHPIAWREMFAVIVACSTWGSHWKRKQVLFHCDNAAVVDIWRHGSCKSPNMMQLVRLLYSLAARGNYNVGIAHIPGVDNILADHLSRFSMQAFRAAAPEAEQPPCPFTIPANLTQH